MAYRELCKPKYDRLHYRLFQKTETHITADGSEDGLINPQGLPNYTVIPSSVLDPEPAAPVGLESTEVEEDDNHEIDDDACDFGEEESFEVVENFEEGERNIFQLLVNDLMNEEERNIFDALESDEAGPYG